MPYSKLFAGLPVTKGRRPAGKKSKSVDGLLCERCRERPVRIQRYQVKTTGYYSYYISKYCSDACRSATQALKTSTYSKKGWLPLDRAQQVLRDAGIKTYAQYRNWKDRPKTLPSEPCGVYGSFAILVFNRVRGTGWAPLDEAVCLIREAGISTFDEYRHWKQRPINLPARFYQTYGRWAKIMGEANG